MNDDQASSVPSLWSSALLVAGMSIGGGMLALPIRMAKLGVLLSLFAFLLMAIAMFCTGYWMGHLALSHLKKGHIIDLSEHFFGKKGKWFAFFSYFVLFYSYLIAYLSALKHLLRALLPQQIPHVPLLSLFSLLLLFLLYRSSALYHWINRLLMWALFVSYLALITGIVQIKAEYLNRSSLTSLPAVLPLTCSAFGYQFVIPSLVAHPSSSGRSLLKILSLGLLIPLVIYSIWLVTVLGNVSLELLEKNPHATAITPLAEAVGQPFLAQVSLYFSLFALLTSFLGVNSGLLHFLNRNRGENERRNSYLRLFFSMLPALYISLHYEHLFLPAIQFGAGASCSLIFGLIPTWIAYRVQRERRFSLAWHHHLLYGGLLCLFSLTLLVAIGDFLHL